MSGTYEDPTKDGDYVLYETLTDERGGFSLYLIFFFRVELVYW